MHTTKTDKSPCPSCVFREYYNKDGSFAAMVDFQQNLSIFKIHVQGLIDYIVSTDFAEGEGVRIKQRRYKSYLKTALGLIGCPDVADIMEKNAVDAKRLLQDRFERLMEWPEQNLHGDEVADARIRETLKGWKELAPEFQNKLDSVQNKFQPLVLVTK